jgi:hypothetical protein
LSLILFLKVHILHATDSEKGREEHRHRQPIQILLDVDVGSVDGESDGRAGRERKGIRERSEDLGNEGVLGSVEVTVESVR